MKQSEHLWRADGRTDGRPPLLSVNLRPRPPCWCIASSNFLCAEKPDRWRGTPWECQNVSLAMPRRPGKVEPNARSVGEKSDCIWITSLWSCFFDEKNKKINPAVLSSLRLWMGPEKSVFKASESLSTVTICLSPLSRNWWREMNEWRAQRCPSLRCPFPLVGCQVFPLISHLHWLVRNECEVQNSPFGTENMPGNTLQKQSKTAFTHAFTNSSCASCRFPLRYYYAHRGNSSRPFHFPTLICAQHATLK